MSTASAPIVIDGANVAHWHGKRKQFSCRGLLLCLSYFKQRNQETFVILPQRWQTKNDFGDLLDGEVLTKLYERGTVSYAPAGSSDDDFIIHYAQMKNALILTNDRFQKEADLRPDWKDVVRNRLLTYTFLEDDFVPNPNPLASRGISMTLDEFLSGAHLGRSSTLADHRNKSTQELLKDYLNEEIKQVPNPSSGVRPKERNNTTSKPSANEKLSIPPKKPKDKYKNVKDHVRPQTEAEKPKKLFKTPNEKMNRLSIDTKQNKTSPIQSRRSTDNNMNPGVNKQLRDIKTLSSLVPNQAVGKFDDEHESNPKSLSPTSPKPRLIYGTGLITDIHLRYGQIKSAQVKNAIIFYNVAYKTTVNDLSKRFRNGDMIAFGFSPKTDSRDPNKAIEAEIVWPSDELVRGYGKIEGDTQFHGFNVSPVQMQMSLVYCPMNTFTGNQDFKQLSSGSWVEFLAAPQLPLESKRPFVSVRTCAPRADGIVVKVTDSYFYVWTRSAGFVAVPQNVAQQSVKFAIGFWVDVCLSFQQLPNDHGCNWLGTDARFIYPKITINKTSDGGVTLSHNAFCGFLKGNNGSLYCPQLGRIGVENDCMKQCRVLNLQPMEKVQFIAKYNNPTKYDNVAYAWIAVGVTRQANIVSEVENTSPALFENVEAIVKAVHEKNNKMSFVFLKTETFGDVFAKAVDCGPSFETWKPGDKVKGLIVAQELPQKNCRAFCIDKV